jgi:raffinose/stachyose/melibiose transport system permease protein
MFTKELLLLAIAAIWWIPFFFLISISLKPTEETFTDPTSLPKNPTLDNFDVAWQGTATVGLGDAFKSSLIITIGSVALLVTLGSLCAYVLARRVGRLSSILFFLFVLGIILPFQLGLVPAYVAMRELHLSGSYHGLILLYAGLLLPLTVFLYTGFIRALPKEYEEAAQVDGAGMTRTFRKVVFPLIRPITATVAILTGLIVWNDFFVPLIFLSGTPKQTLPVAIYSFVGEHATIWGVVFAAVAISVIPLLLFFFVAQRQLIRGFTGGIKS